MFSVSLQVQPHHILNEGIETALDRLAGCGLDALHLNTHNYYWYTQSVEQKKQIPVEWAPDHIPENPYLGMYGRSWAMHDPDLFSDIGLFHRMPAAGELDAGRDVLQEIIDAANARGMEVHGRYLDGWGNIRLESMPDWEEAHCLSLDGERIRIPCFANPRVKEWWIRTVEDTYQRYPGLAGMFYGIERGSLLSDMLGWQHQPPRCFCEHCLEEGRQAGLDLARVREGLAKLHRVCNTISDPHRSTPGFAFTEIMAVLVDYPEILTWDRLDRDRIDWMADTARERMKAVAPDKVFSQMNLAEADWVKDIQDLRDRSGLVERCDAVVMRLYGHVTGPRMVNSARNRGEHCYLNELAPEERFAWLWHNTYGKWVRGQAAPEMDGIAREGIPPEIEATSITRIREECGPEMPIIAAPGFDISYPFKDRRETPESYIRELVTEAVKEGAEALVLCREYPELSLKTLRTAADAFRDARKAD